MKAMILYTALMLAFSIMTVAGCQDTSPNTAAQTAPAESAAAPEAPAPAPAPAPTETAAADEAAVSETAPSAGAASGLTKEFLITQQFRLSKVNEADFSGERVPTLEFGDGFMVTGRICNNYRGQGELADGVLTVKAMASTRMLCPGTGLDELETRFFQMLEAGAQIAMNGSLLTLKQGDTALIFESQ